MTNEPQPDVRWAPLEPAPKNTGRIWLIVGLAVAALVIVGILLFVFLPRGDAPEPGASGSPSPSASASASPIPTPSTSTSPEPSETAIVTPPPVADPSMEAFRGNVGGWLNSAPRGLDIIQNNPGPDALPVVDSLQQDAQRLSDARPPSSIGQEWSDGVSAYAQRLIELRGALTDESGVPEAVDAARAAVQSLRTLVGL